jgi:hypothetical protein
VRGSGDDGSVAGGRYFGGRSGSGRFFPVVAVILTVVRVVIIVVVILILAVFFIVGVVVVVGRAVILIVALFVAGRARRCRGSDAGRRGSAWAGGSSTDSAARGTVLCDRFRRLDRSEKRKKKQGG